MLCCWTTAGNGLRFIAFTIPVLIKWATMLRRFFILKWKLNLLELNKILENNMMVLNKATFLTEGYTVQVIFIKSYSENKINIADLTLGHGSPSKKNLQGAKAISGKRFKLTFIPLYC